MYRRVKFEYYHVVFRKKDDPKNARDRLFDLVVWIDKAMSKSLEGRTYDYKSEQARLDNAYWDDELGYYFLHFVRLRDTNIPSKAKLESQVEPFELDDDEYLGEEVSALYDEDYHILMLQRNRYSLGPEGIEEYLNLIWDNPDETIYLRPICPPDVFEMVRNSKEYRRINISFSDLNLQSKKKFVDRLKSPLKQIVESFNEYEGVNAQVIITMGNAKGYSLRRETVEDTLIDIQENKEFFSNAEIAKKDSDDARVELIDLFEHKAHDFATFRMEKRESLSHYAIAKEMWAIYSNAEGCNNRRQVIRSYLRL